MDTTEDEPVGTAAAPTEEGAGPAVEEAAAPHLIDALPYFDRDMEKVPGTDKAVSATTPRHTTVPRLHARLALLAVLPGPFLCRPSAAYSIRICKFSPSPCFTCNYPSFQPRPPTSFLERRY